MTTTAPPQDDRETLSALFDGELRDDAARFALRRLEHDATWRDSCGRWQLAGDLLRRGATGVAPVGFAARVASAMAQEAAQPVVAAANASAAPARAASGQAAPAGRPRARRAWFGGAALAASVAAAALFVVRPLGEGDATAPGVSAPSIAVAPAAAPEATPAPAAAIPDPRPEPATPAASVAVLAGAVAATELPRRAVEQRARATSPRAVQRDAVARRAVEPVRVADGSDPAPAATAVVQVASAPAPATADPFKPQVTDTLTARPWPRAVLPGTASAGALTASYGTAASSPSFYPFEPAREAAAAAPTATDEANDATPP